MSRQRIASIARKFLRQRPTSAVAFAAENRMSSKIVKRATLKIYPGAPHGLCSTPKDEVNADLLAFIRT
jgi:hypothetical protein